MRDSEPAARHIRLRSFAALFLASLPQPFEKHTRREKKPFADAGFKIENSNVFFFFPASPACRWFLQIMSALALALHLVRFVHTYTCLDDIWIVSLSPACSMRTPVA